MIRCLVLLALISGCLSQWEDPDWKDSTKGNHKRYHPLPGSFLVQSPDVNYAVRTKLSSSTCSSMFTCVGCNQVEMCKPSATGFVPSGQIFNCPIQHPYCDYSTGSCTDVPDVTCGKTDTFVCSDNGYFPDTTNCSLYHACNNYKSQLFSCGNGQVFDSDNNVCSDSAECLSVSCKGYSGYKVPLGNTHFYTYCENQIPATVLRCPGEFKLNQTSQNCEAICEKNGLMADDAPCKTTFYKCSTVYINSNESFIQREYLSCPSGEVFEASSYQCVLKTSTTCK